MPHQTMECKPFEEGAIAEAKSFKDRGVNFET